MVDHPAVDRHVVNIGTLPKYYPTHRHASSFWEALGRAVASFGFLEEVLGKAIFAFTGTREISADKLDEEYANWIPKLEKALSDTLNPLISTYGDAVAAHGGATISNIDELLEDLRKAAVLRNVICHGSWRIPDSNGKSVPLFVDKKGNVFAEEIDGVYLEHLQRHTAELACSIVNTVTHMGLQFPGSNGPGMPIFSRQS